MTDVLQHLSDDDWNRFQKDMLVVASSERSPAGVPAAPEDTVQSAVKTFLRRRDVGSKRELLANTPESVRLVLLYWTWAKRKERQRSGQYRKNKAIPFSTLDPTEQSQRGGDIGDPKAADAELNAFFSEIMDHVAGLPSDSRQVAELCLKGYDKRDIAAEMGISLAAVNGLFLRMRISLLE